MKRRQVESEIGAWFPKAVASLNFQSRPRARERERAGVYIYGELSENFEKPSVGNDVAPN